MIVNLTLQRSFWPGTVRVFIDSRFASFTVHKSKFLPGAVRVSAFPKFAQDELVKLLNERGVALSPTTNTVAISAVVCPQSPVIILHFKPSLNALSLLSDVISSMKVLSLKCG
jgi:hypothetical protein